MARRAGEFGVRTGAVEVDIAAVTARVRDIIDRGGRGARGWLESLEGVDIVEGDARLVAPGEVRVGDRTLRAPRVILATGARPTAVPIPGLDRTPHLTSDDVYGIREDPGRLLVVGAGPIALELGQALGRLGAHVTMVEVAPRLLPAAEPELADELGGCLRDEGIAIHCGARIARVEPAGAGVRMHLDEGPAPALEADTLLVAAGRTPNLEVLGDDAGVTAGRRGMQVDGMLRADGADGVWAAGDLLEPEWGHYTHTARAHGAHAAAAALGLDPAPMDRDPGPRALFTDPELVSVGLTEREARERGGDIGVGTSRFSGGKARALGEERGAAKVIVDRSDGSILGAHVLGHHASDLVHPVVVAMGAGAGAAGMVASAYHVHPTMGEVVKAAVAAASEG